jgi:hypothetical protein
MELIEKYSDFIAHKTPKTLKKVKIKTVGTWIFITISTTKKMPICRDIFPI